MNTITGFLRTSNGLAFSPKLLSSKIVRTGIHCLRNYRVNIHTYEKTKIIHSTYICSKNDIPTVDHPTARIEVVRKDFGLAVKNELLKLGTDKLTTFEIEKEQELFGLFLLHERNANEGLNWFGFKRYNSKQSYLITICGNDFIKIASKCKTAFAVEAQDFKTGTSIIAHVDAKFSYDVKILKEKKNRLKEKVEVQTHTGNFEFDFTEGFRKYYSNNMPVFKTTSINPFMLSYYSTTPSIATVVTGKQVFGKATLIQHFREQ